MLSPDSRVLVINVCRIGDTLLVTPILRAVKVACPEGRLGCLAHPDRAALLQGLAFLDELGTITAKVAWSRGWFRRHRWDYALVYGHDAPLVRYALRVASRVIAFRQHDAALDARLWRAVTPPAQVMHAVHERLLLAAELGVTTDDNRLAYAPTETELVAARDWLTRRAIAARPLVGFQVASFPTKSYRDWPLDSFVELGRRLLAARPRAHVLILGDRESRASAARLAGALGPRATSAAGALDLRRTAALIARLDLYVGVDTGPTHIAGALGVPMVALYHCRHRGAQLAPLGHERLTVIEHPTADADCTPSAPMAAISVDTVWEKVQQRLS
jgi:heptosyltransferase-3